MFRIPNFLTIQGKFDHFLVKFPEIITVGDNHFLSIHFRDENFTENKNDQLIPEA